MIVSQQHWIVSLYKSIFLFQTNKNNSYQLNLAKLSTRSKSLIYFFGGHHLLHSFCNKLRVFMQDYLSQNLLTYLHVYIFRFRINYTQLQLYILDLNIKEVWEKVLSMMWHILPNMSN